MTVESSSRSAKESSRPANIAVSLLADPSRRVGIPVMTGISDAAERGFQFVPATLVGQRLLDECADERAPTAATRTAIEFVD